MQIRRRKSWEIWSHAVASGRQMVDIRGAVPDDGSLSPFLYCQSEGLETRTLTRQRQYHLLFTAPGMVQHEMGIITVGHHSPCVYPLSTLRNRLSPNLPGLPPPCLLQAIKYCRQEWPGNKATYRTSEEVYI